jgi:hypothetical protein
VPLISVQLAKGTHEPSRCHSEGSPIRCKLTLGVLEQRGAARTGSLPRILALGLQSFGLAMYASPPYSSFAHFPVSKGTTSNRVLP